MQLAIQPSNRTKTRNVATILTEPAPGFNGKSLCITLNVCFLNSGGINNETNSHTTDQRQDNQGFEENLWMCPQRLQDITSALVELHNGIFPSPNGKPLPSSTLPTFGIRTRMCIVADGMSCGGLEARISVGGDTNIHAATTARGSGLFHTVQSFRFG